MTPDPHPMRDLAAEQQPAQSSVATAEPRAAEPSDEAPEKVPAKVWVTLVTFAAFVVAFLTCASKFLFN